MKKFSESQIDHFIKNVHAKERQREARRDKEEEKSMLDMVILENKMEPNPIAGDATKAFVFKKPEKKNEVSGFIRKIRSRSKKKMYNDIANRK